MDNDNVLDESSTNNNLCGLCNDKPSKYSCPRCNVLYCSVGCYKSVKHLECSENFYKQCVEEELSSMHADAPSKQKMVDILTRWRKQDNEISEEEEDTESELDSDDYDDDLLELKDRVTGIHLDNANELWDVLTESERNEFRAMISNDDVSKIIPEWEPWWMFRRSNPLIEDVDDDKAENEEEVALKKCPQIILAHKLKHLTSMKPSRAIKYNIINVVASYAFVARYFNGELNPGAEAVDCLLQICSNFNSNANFDNVQLAIESVAQKCIQSDLIKTNEYSIEIMKEDTMLILSGPSESNKTYYCRSLLSDTYRLLCDARNTLKNPQSTEKSSGEFSKIFPDHTSSVSLNLVLNTIKKCVKKIEYYLSYIETYGIVTA